MKKTLLFLSLFTLTVWGASAQKLMPVSGSVAPLKGAGKMLVEYDYSDLEVGDYNSESDYTSKRVAELNAKEKGRGDQFLESWEYAKKNKYPVKFEALFNKEGARVNLSISQNAEAPQYIIIVKTVFIEPGFNVGVMKKPSAVSFRFTIVEAADRTKVVGVFSLKNVPGAQAMGFDFDTSTRISESYAKAGKIFAKYIADNHK